RIRDVALGSAHGDVVAFAPAEQRARDRCLHADPTLVDVRLVRSDDAIRDLVALLVFERHPRAEECTGGITRWFADDDQLVEALRQEAHPTIDLAQPALAIDVLGVLGAVALRRGIRDFLRHARP